MSCTGTKKEMHIVVGHHQGAVFECGCRLGSGSCCDTTVQSAVLHEWSAASACCILAHRWPACQLYTV
jgi:hypothetical protein